MSLHQAKQLREERAKNAELIKANLAEIAKAETTEARKQELLESNDKIFKQVDAAKATIDQLERQADLESEINDRKGLLPERKGLSDDPGERREQVNRAIETYLRFGVEGMSDEARSLVIPRDGIGQAAIADAVKHLRGYVREARDLSTSTSGAVLPNEYWSMIEENMLAFGGMREVSDVIRTSNGNAFVLPFEDDTTNAAAIVSEASSNTTSVDVTLNSLTLNAYKYSTRIFFSREFLSDYVGDFNAKVQSLLGTRLARGLNTAFTTGTGSSQPNGIATATSSAGTMGSGTAVTITDLTTLEHSIDPAYRRGARWMFHDAMLKNLKRMVDTTGQPIWHPGVQVRGPDTIYGYPYTINQDVAQPTVAGGKVIYFGDFKKYKIRDQVGGGYPIILRLVERFADKDQIAFYLYSRHDGDLLDAGNDPVKHLVTGSPQS